jgi:hypothetical protein
MKNKSFQTLLKAWIAIASLGAFLGGWILLGHSDKPVEASALSGGGGSTELKPLPTLAPLPSFNSSSLQPIQQQAPASSFVPRLRTRGS